MAASGILSSIQCLSTKLLESIRGTTQTQCQQDPASPASNQDGSVRKDLEKLSRMVARIQAVQQDAEEREIHDRSVGLWLAELRGVAYEAEDVLDEFHYEVLRSIVESGDAAMEKYHKNMGTKRKFSEMYTSSSSSTITTSIPDWMGAKITNIIERFEEISNARRDLHLKEEDGTRLVLGPQIRPPTSSYVDERGIFGREEEKKKIIHLLSPSNGPDFMVLPIVGMGGLGKTTLAQLVYNDSMFGQFFKNKAWVSVSEEFDIVRITKAVLESVSDSSCHFSELSKLQNVLNEKVRGSSVFLVLDDIWNEKRTLWEHFRVAFHGVKTVRILATTRNKSVAEVMQTISYFSLGCLAEERCWLLFKHFAFDNREASENPNLVKIGRDIVKKCNGLPLANKVLGGMLRYETDEEKWKEVLESNISEIDETGEIMPPLWLSYRKLPLPLRPCLQFLSMFPKGKQFENDKVIRLWMAQGYLNDPARSKKTLEDIGNEYFDELQGRSLVDCRYGNQYCLHDLIHDLARSASAGASRLNIDDNQLWTNSCKVHHMYLTKQDELSDCLEASNYRAIRTFVKECPRSHIIDSATFSNIPCVRALELGALPNTLAMLSYSMLPDNLGMFKHLRYLSIGGDRMKRFPESLCLLYNLQSLHLHCPYIQVLPKKIKNLVNLRYFRLCSYKIQLIPESVCLLFNLNTLILERCGRFKKLPGNIQQLTNLHNINLNHCPSISFPSGTGKLPKLRTLSGHFNVMGDDVIGGLRELKDMNQLDGLLCISGLKNIADVEYSRKANLISKPNLCKLILNFEEVEGSSSSFLKGDHYKYHVLSIAVHSSSNAKKEINDRIQEGVLESLQPHGNLMELEILHYGGRRFPPWLLDPSLVSKLRSLTLHFRMEITFIPPSFGQFLHLKYLEIHGSGDTIRKVGDEHLAEFLFADVTSKQPAEVIFPSLVELSFKNMLNLVEWHTGNDHFRYLRKLIIHHCPKAWKLNVPQKVQLLEVCASGCQKIVIASQSKLKEILISDCRELITIDWKKGDLHILERISLKGCPKLLLPSIIPQNLEQILIDDCGFQEIDFSSLVKLQKLSISDCRELITIHYKSEDLPILRSILLSNCPNLRMPLFIPEELEQIKIHECNFEEINFSSHCKLQKVSISNCRELVSIYYKTGGFAVLKNVTLTNCPRLLIFSAIIEDLKQLDVRDCGFQEIKLSSKSKTKSTSISDYRDLIPIYELNIGEAVKIANCPKLKIYSAITVLPYGVQIRNCGFREVMIPERCRILSICDCQEIMSICWSGGGLNSLIRRVEVVNCPQLELARVPKEVEELNIVSCGIREIIFPSKSKIASIRISHCPGLISHHFLNGNLSLLQKLSIKYCPQLYHLTIPNQLKELDISDCRVSEICLFPNSKLHKVTISSCTELTAIKGLQAQCLLRSLQICQCPILQFSMDGVIYPMMEMMQIYDCPKLDLGNQEKLRLYQNDAMVKRMIASGDESICFPESSVNGSIPLLENSKFFFMNGIKAVEHPSSSLISCQHIWLFLPSLLELEIHNCRKVISVTGVDNLNNLKYLVISDCPELCEWKDKALPSALQLLKLVSCCKLSHAPLQSVDKHLGTLEIIIRNCPLMKD